MSRSNIQWTITNDGKRRVLRRDIWGNPTASVTGPRTYEGYSTLTGKTYTIEARGRTYTLGGIRGRRIVSNAPLASVKDDAEHYDREAA